MIERNLLPKIIHPVWNAISLVAGGIVLLNDLFQIGSKWLIITAVLAISAMAVSLWLAGKGIRHRRTMRGIGDALRKRRKDSKHPFRVRFAETFDELKVQVLQDQATYPDEFNWSVDRWQAFYGRNSHVAYLIEQEVNGRWLPLGGISIFPLTRTVADRLLLGEIGEHELRPEDILILEEEHTCSKWHIGGVVIFDRASTPTACAFLLAEALSNWLAYRIGTIPFDVTALAYSQAGGKLLEHKFGFVAQEPKKGHHGMVMYKLSIPNPARLSEVIPASLLGGVDLRRTHGRDV
jgi:hypothetical protein